MAKPQEREKARQLRKVGKSIKEIASAVGVSPSTASRWVQDVELSKAQIHSLQQNQKQWSSQNKGAQQNKKNAHQLRQEYQQQGRTKAREKDILHLQSCMLYWAEGAKDKNRIDFVNSDPNMIRLFIRSLRNCLEIPDGQIRVRIHCHTEVPQEINKTLQFWSQELDLPLENFGKVQTK